MTRSDRRTFTHEFKEQIVQLVQNGKPKAEIVHEYSIHLSTLNRWIQQHEATGSFKESDNRSDQENELLALQKENQRLRMENDILKQAALILGRK